MKGLILTGYRDFSIPWPGRELDPAYLFNPLPRPFGELFEGKLFGFYSHPFAFLSSFPYRLLGTRGLYVIPLVSAFFLLAAVRSLADLLPGRPRSLATGIVGLCTPVWFYSVDFWEHLPADCLVAWSVVAVLKYHARPTYRPLALGALFLGFSVYFRDNLYLFAPPLMAAVAAARPFRWRPVLFFGAILAVTLAPLWAFNWIQFRHPLGLRLVSAASAGGGWAHHLGDRPEVLNQLLLNGHGNMILSLIATLPFAVLFFVSPRVAPQRRDAAMRTLAVVGLASGVIVASGHLLAERPIWWLMKANGLFAASPVLIFGLVRGREEGSRGQSNTAGGLIRLIVVSYVGVYVLASPLANTAGVHWGCRLLLSVYPLLGVLAAAEISQWCAGAARRTVATVLAAAVIVVSLLAQVYSQKLLYERKSFSAALSRLVAERPEQVVAALGWFVPQEIGTVFYDKKVFLVNREEHLHHLLTLMHGHGVREVLVVSAEPLRMGPSPATRVLKDGLNFISVCLTPLKLGP
ncbi:MAG: hypothetical protein MUE60_04435 [Candidatus Eisenbacteria bacterium]|nr:hypothetical protein [Candidatus Eisenbacteria bacterium]